jgi:3-hydroxyisobutyrate dehydrogenase
MDALPSRIIGFVGLGNLVHETESQVILNGSDDSNFLDAARTHGVPAKLADTVTEMFRDTQASYGPRALSPRSIQRVEDDCGIQVRAPGFSPQLIDQQPEEPGEEIIPAKTCYVFAPDGS